jgi:hypothetical protein
MENKIVIRVNDWMRDEIEKHVKLAGESKSVVIRGMIKDAIHQGNSSRDKHEEHTNGENQMAAE